MATGIPRNNANGRDRHESRADPSSEIVLQYEGKQSVAEVLQGERAHAKAVWPEVPSDHPSNLYFAENLTTLRSLCDDSRVRSQVRLVYIDPPFATKSVFQSRKLVDAYSDLLVGSHYLEFLRQRLIVLRELLAADGSIYVHLDDKMACHAKVILDEIFGVSNFRNVITRKKCNPKNYTRKTYGNVADFILFYTKTSEYVWNRPIEPWTAARAGKEYEYNDLKSGRRYKKVPIHAPGIRRGETGKPWRGMLPPPGKHWQYTPTRLDELDARGDIYWSPNGNPRRKVYLDESDGVAVQDIWLDYRDAHNQNIRVTGYPTEKNPDLLKRIVAASSNPGDLVLDCFCGSGTTLAVADSLNRRWIGIDSSAEAIRTTLQRFSHGVEPMGDFVAKRDVSPEVTSLPLFTDSVTLVNGKEQKRVTGFNFLADDASLDEAEAIARDWQKSINDPAPQRSAKEHNPATCAPSNVGAQATESVEN